MPLGLGEAFQFKVPGTRLSRWVGGAQKVMQLMQHAMSTGPHLQPSGCVKQDRPTLGTCGAHSCMGSSWALRQFSSRPGNEALLVAEMDVIEHILRHT